MNYLHPGLLVSLRESLEAWREARRRGALRRLEVEGAGGWLNRPVGRGVVWLETVAGFPLALYGLVNHVVAIALLYWTVLLEKESGRGKILATLERGLVILGCYAVEVFLVARFWGRHAAGYYLLTLPLSALYLWRYAWLLRHHTRIAFLSSKLSSQAARSKRLRKDFLREISQALNHHARMLGLLH
jgi:hypothetical protein